MVRPLASATSTALDGVVLPFATIVRLDIVGDPLYAWTGLDTLTFTAGQTGDSALDGISFLGLGTVAQIGIASDGAGGSDVMELSLAGVSLAEPMLRQLIFNHNRWQFKPAYVWLMLLDPDTSAIVGKPFRIKTGRIDQMPYEEDKSSGIVKCRIEGQQSYGKQPLLSRYSEQRNIDALDGSQDAIYNLANMSAKYGENTGSIYQDSSQSFATRFNQAWG